MPDVLIKKLEKEEREGALNLVWKVFRQYEAPDYTREGVDDFYKSIHDENYLSLLSVYGAFLEGKLIGVIATRNEGKHLALFFVDGKYHRQGVGRQLFEAVRTENMTVYSAPYAIPVYLRLGFEPTDPEQTVNGVRFTPMQLK